MKVAILFDEIKPQDVLDDKDVLQQVDMVVKSLKRLKHDYVLVPCTLDLQTVKDTIFAEKPNVVFNLLDTLDSRDGLAYLPVALLDAYQIPHTGPDAISLSLTTRKLLVKEKLQAAGIPTPGEINLETTANLTGKWLIKGASEDGSFGMSDASVITGNTKEVQEKLQSWNKVTGHISFAEQYIDGREFTVPFLCGRTLPVAEITYVDYPADKPRILAQAAKWQPLSFEAQHTGSCYDFGYNDSHLIEKMETIARQCLRLFKLTGWGRVDFRCAEGIPYVIDINSGSCLAEDAWFYGSLIKTGVTFDAAMQKVMEEAINVH